MNFSVPSDGLADWDNKPWALYSGAFTDGLAKKLMNYVKQDDYNQDFDNGLHRTVPLGEGDGHRGCGGRPLLPGGRGEGGKVHSSSMRDDFRIGLRDEGCDLESDGQTDLQDEPGPGLAICSFGLNDGYLGRRDGKIEGIFTEDKLRYLISRLWEDFYTEGVMIYNVDPQPGAGDCSETAGLYVIVDFLPQVDPRHFGRIPVLIRARGSEIHSDFVQEHLEAVMVPERASWVELALASGLQHQCRSRVGNQCVVRIGTDLVLNELKYVIPDGALITFLYDIEDLPKLISHYTCSIGQRIPERLTLLQDLLSQNVNRSQEDGELRSMISLGSTHCELSHKIFFRYRARSSSLDGSRIRNWELTPRMFNVFLMSNYMEAHVEQTTSDSPCGLVAKIDHPWLSSAILEDRRLL